MPTAQRIAADYKHVYTVGVQPVDFGTILPSGHTLASAVVTVSGSDSVLVAATAIRTGNTIVDLVYAVGTAGVTYELALKVQSNSAIGGQTWQHQINMAVVVQA